MKIGMCVVFAFILVMVSGSAFAGENQLLDMCQQAIKAIGKTQVASSQITMILSIVGSFVGLLALFVAWSQMKIASAKVKLDLYNKRFNVYLVTLAYYLSSYEKVEGGIEARAFEFIKHYRESQFLFDPKDGVYDTLGRIKNYGSQILAYEDAKSGKLPGLSSETESELHEQSVSAREKFDKDLPILEAQMAKYINFTVIRGWRFW